MAKQLGKKASECIGNNHEAAGDREGQPPRERDMDLSNNETGRSLGSQEGSCADSCTDALNRGDLVVLEP